MNMKQAIGLIIILMYVFFASLGITIRIAEEPSFAIVVFVFVSVPLVGMWFWRSE